MAREKSKADREPKGMKEGSKAEEKLDAKQTKHKVGKSSSTNLVEGQYSSFLFPRKN